MQINVAHTPGEALDYQAAIVVVDVIRATTTALTALAQGYREVICCADIETARATAAELGPGAMLAGERQCVRQGPEFHRDQPGIEVVGRQLRAEPDQLAMRLDHPAIARGHAPKLSCHHRAGKIECRLLAFAVGPRSDFLGQRAA